MKFFVWLNEQQQGPFDDENIQLMVSRRQITQDTLLCPEGGDLDWTPAKELFAQDLFSLNSLEVPRSIETKPNDRLNVFTDDGSRLEIRLHSGAELRIKAVRLYDEIDLVQINSKRVEAMTKLQGVSTGLGSIGSIGWVLASSVVIGAVEEVLSASAASSGTNLLTEVIKMEQKLRNEGVFFPVGRIEQIENPVPGLWRIPSEKEVQVKVGETLFVSGKMVSKTVPTAFIHSGEEFVSLRTEDDAVFSIRWSSVERYFFQKSVPPA